MSVRGPGMRPCGSGGIVKELMVSLSGNRHPLALGSAQLAGLRGLSLLPRDIPSLLLSGARSEAEEISHAPLAVR